MLIIYFDSFISWYITNNRAHTDHTIEICAVLFPFLTYALESQDNKKEQVAGRIQPGLGGES